MGGVSDETLLNLWQRYRAAADMLDRMALRNQLLALLFPSITAYLTVDPDHGKLIAALDKWNPARSSLYTFMKMVARTPQWTAKTLHAVNECDQFGRDGSDGDLSSLASTVAGTDADPADTATIAAAWRAIASAISRNEYQALDLLYRQAMTQAQAADTAGTSPATMLRRHHAALLKLRCNNHILKLLGEVSCGQSRVKTLRAGRFSYGSATCRSARACG